MRLPDHPTSQLDQARGSRRGDETEIEIPGVRIGVTELGVIERIEELPSYLEARQFSNAEILLHTDIPVIRARPEQNTASRVSEKPWLRRGEARGIEPLPSVRPDVTA